MKSKARCSGTIEPTAGLNQQFSMYHSQAYQKAIEVLHENIVSIGKLSTFVACPQKVANYFALWTRDAVFAVIGSCATDDDKLLRTSRDALVTLHKHQTELGRIPAYINLSNPRCPEVVFDGWGRIETLDSQMWYVVGCKVFYAKTEDRLFVSPKLLESYGKALKLLEYRTAGSDASHLVDWPLSSEWADQMARHHHVTSLECLRIIALDSYAFLLKSAGNARLAKKYEKQENNLRDQINETLLLTPENVEKLMVNYTDGFGPGYFSAFASEVVKYVKENSPPFYQSYLAPYEISSDHVRRFDAYGNLLAIISGVADEDRTKQILDYIKEKSIDKPFPLRTLDPPVKPGDQDFLPFYKFAKNKPYEYHNGGIWPHISSFYVQALLKAGKKKEAEKVVGELIRMIKQPGHETELSFSEYYNGKTGKPGKLANDHQCWSAAGVVSTLNMGFLNSLWEIY